ncbi:MAG: hotdog fold thioesterase [Saprospiraceae bacterium]|nr:hotdog fold thioesterase [Saprospiraceae bacterium]MBK6566772.1 hotdog fold thioesterase [Saprospiraceae bacterium]MBK6785447.1 hotdog fold thioesterase [Saprospiraceae bacterium]MBK7522889.1 hotdog fold thioesterase [Saprospiraceae bacterium]MBK8370729.1 hotdog fold thioesterase [Saprospiraceae bacterium]
MDENKQETAEKIVSEMMLGKDAFSLWMGVELLEVKPGFCKIKCIVREDMLNGFYIAHGGITYSLADSALAFASNAHNNKAVSVETNISHVKKVVAGDILTAECTEKNLSTRFGIYEVEVSNQKDEKVALFKGTVFRTGEKWVH